VTDLTELEALIALNESKQIYVSPAVKELLAEFQALRSQYASYRAFVHHTLTREADLAAGLGLLTPPERLRDLAELLEKA
jgi:hypothetical protein